MLNETLYAHIALDEAGTPIISGTTTKVIELVLDKSAYGWGAEELHLQHPHLSLGQIYSALAYYWDHQDQLDADIQRRLEQVEQVQRATRPTTLVEKLKDRGLLT
jgi:uncharacterized protein (DUF433 family)